MLKNLQDILDGGVEQALLRLWSAQLSDAEAAAIRSRAKADPRYREKLLGTLEMHARMEDLSDDPAIRAIAGESAELSGLHRSQRRAAFGIAAGIVLAVGAVLVYLAPWSGPDDSHLEKHFTRVGEQKTVKLDDGSAVTLNTGTQLVVDYSNRSRRILLERGEAFFDVAEDAQRPFNVEMGMRSVTAIGTAFNVRKDPERYSVAVLKGAVWLHTLTDEGSAAALPVLLDGEAVAVDAPAQRLVETGCVAELDVSRNELTAFRPESMERYLGWRRGMLRFDREPLYQVVKELNRYTRRKILIEDAGIMELNVYAAVSITELEAALIALERLLPIEVTWHYDRIVITGSEGGGRAEGRQLILQT